MFYATHMIGFAAGGVVTPATFSWTDNAFDTSNSTAYTFSGKTIGTAASNRSVIVGVQGGDGTATVSTLTVGGVSASYVTRVQNGSQTMELWKAAVPTGTTADVVVTWSGGQNRCAMGCGAAYGAATSATATASSTANPMAASLAIPANGFGLGYGCDGGSGGTYTWTNLTEAFDAAAGAEGLSHSGASLNVTGAASATRTCTQSGSSAPTLLLASFGPA
jgi:hypothetical protein